MIRVCLIMGVGVWVGGLSIHMVMSDVGVKLGMGVHVQGGFVFVCACSCMYVFVCEFVFICMYGRERVHAIFDHTNTLQNQCRETKMKLETPVRLRLCCIFFSYLLH